MDKDGAKSPRTDPEPRGSPTFLRHKSLLNSNPSAPPPISNFESFKLRSKLLKSHLSASAAEECVAELARFGIETEADLSRLKMSIIEQLRVRPKVRAILKELRFHNSEEFKLEELLRESKLFEKDSDAETIENCNRLGGLIRDNLSVKRWRDFFCIVGLDLQEIGFNDEERSALMSLIKFAADFNRKSLVAQVDQFKKHLTHAVELYSSIMTSLSEATQFVRPGAPLDIFPDEIATIKQMLVQSRTDAVAAMEKMDPDREVSEMSNEPTVLETGAVLANISEGSKWSLEPDAVHTNFRVQVKGLAVLNAEKEMIYRNRFQETLDHVNFVGESAATKQQTAAEFIAGGGGFYDDDDDSVSYITVSVEKRKSGMSQVLLRTAETDEMLAIPAVSHGKDMIDVLRKTYPEKFSRFELKKVKENKAEFRDALARMDDYLLTDKYKFAIVYVKGGQKTETDIFANMSGSTEYEEFLSMLGSRVNLKGWSKFAGGLDVKQNRTGTHSIFAEYDNKEIMFHVATLMPNNENSEDLKLEKKRHVGNDVATIVFLEPGATFDPSWIRTQFTQVFLLVSPLKHNGRLYFRMQVVKRDSIPSFGPSMPACLYPRSQETRAFILTKLINSERAAMETSVFAEKTARARSGIIRDLVKQHKALRGKKSRALLMKKENSSKAIPRPVQSTIHATRVQRRPSLSAMDLAIPVRFNQSSGSNPVSTLESTESTSPKSLSARPPVKSPSSGTLTPASDSRHSSPGSSAATSPRKAPKNSESSSSSLAPADAEKKKSKHKRQKSSSSLQEEVGEDQ
eukprot:TRINITY_DN14044_c0_g1_i1.p1 TRINITY_DN14044_c0_g1~~TRINITY_DN14044_c0_g1_i1.p1  ORF type:complete len:823 (+),score=222.35 TRINITY_DN14044_c0_g1_i1:73-2469(+)